MATLKNLLGLVALALAGVAQAGPVLVTTPAALGANDSVNWSQIGPDGTIFGPNFGATSTNAVAVSGRLTGANGCIAVVGGSVCGWNAGPGFAAGNSLLWAEDTDGNGSAPLSLSFSSVFGAGLWLQANAFGPFAAQIDAFNGVTNIGTFTESSNANGDGLFIGVLDSVADITGITLTLQGCNGASCDIAVNTLMLREAVNAVPEPSSLALAVLALSLLGRRRARALVATTEASS